MTIGIARFLGSLSLCWPGATALIGEHFFPAVLQDSCASTYDQSLLQSKRVLKAATFRENLQVPHTSSVQAQAEVSTLFYHIHIPRTGGITVANLLVGDICTPFEDNITLRFPDGRGVVSTEAIVWA